MAKLKFSPKDALFYDHTAPKDEAGCTFVFFNALTGDSGGWEAIIGPVLREAGHMIPAERPEKLVEALTFAKEL
ncbi:MAG: hypothetical protein JRK53_13010 [Deltaproteobacteria bacterium]|nr:hypothetical protein [Deltaproteobacteria bacterium]MBW1816047.1 hypothetical protein [Deltaproteobacteria bacterium]